MKNPPFQITPLILNQSLEIAEVLGKMQGLHYSIPPIELRRTNRLKGIQSSLAIEGNTLSLKDIEAINMQQIVLAEPREILEVKNALTVYQQLNKLQPYSVQSFKNAHALLMKGLVKENGCWRTKNVGIYSGKILSHMAPSKEKVPQLMKNLFAYLRINNNISALLKACICHYEIEFIHPFMDGNGRIGRLWQQVILRDFNPIFEFIPVETLIKENQDNYYLTLRACDHAGSSTLFIEFALDLINKALKEFYEAMVYQPKTPKDRLALALKEFEKNKFTRKKYISLIKTISTATASRDLAYGVREKILHKEGEKAETKYSFY